MNRFLIATLPLALFAGAFPGSAEITTTDNTSISTPGCYTGNGCVNSGFTQTTDGTTELDLNAIIRYAGPVTPVGNVYNVPTGTSGGLAVWDYGFSIITPSTSPLSNYTYQMTLYDVGTGTSTTGDPLAIPDDDWYGPNGKDDGLLSANLNNAYSAQNYEDFSFPGLGTPGFDPNANDTYIVTLTEYSGGVYDNSDSIVINAGTGAVPEPGTFALAGMVLAGLGLARKKFGKV
jgi:hypothetical protein